MTDPAESNAPLRLSPVQALGGLAVVASLVLAVFPDLVTERPSDIDLFEATERHVRWGLGVGLGAIFVFGRWRRPWSVVVAWLALCVSGGYLLARFVGIAIEGPTNQMQWVLVAVELAICGVAAGWIRHRKGAPDRA